MYDSREQFLVLRQGGSKSYGENSRRKNKTAVGEKKNRGPTEMRKRGNGYRRMVWKLTGVICMLLIIGGVSLVLIAQALAASEIPKAGNWEKRAGAEKEAGAANTWEMEKGGWEMRQGQTISSNIAVPEIIKSGIFGEPLIVIDAGHGGEDKGGEKDGILEKDINLAIAKLVRDKLCNMGYRVQMIREDDAYVEKEDRVKQANENKAAIYVSIHQNISEDWALKGIEVWYDGTDGGGDSKRLAQLVGQQTVKKTQAAERGIREDLGLHETSKLLMPACAIWTGFLTNDEEGGKLTTEEYQEQAAGGIAQGIDYYFHPKTMYLTFDDGPTEENTSRVLDVLKERNVKATFFVVGENVRRNPEVAKRIVAEGHTIGIHCDNHNYDAVYQSVDSYIRDFEAAYETVKEVTGVEVKLFRFPGGSVNAHNKEISEAIIGEMTERGFIYFDWNASLEDAVAKPTPEQLIANGVETTLGRKKVVMLAHDVVYNTGICLGDLLDRLPEYRMEVLTEEVEPVQF